MYSSGVMHLDTVIASLGVLAQLLCECVKIVHIEIVIIFSAKNNV
jgi:hypothetical protein